MLDPSNCLGGGAGVGLLLLLAAIYRWRARHPALPVLPSAPPDPTLPDVAVRPIAPLSDTEREALLTVPPILAGAWEREARYSIDQVIADAERELRK